jgi:hypothetical protein
MSFLLTTAGKKYVTLHPATADINCANFFQTSVDKSMLFFWQ